MRLRETVRANQYTTNKGGKLTREGAEAPLKRISRLLDVTPFPEVLKAFCRWNQVSTTPTKKRVLA
jgi:hypothetical protein